MAEFLRRAGYPDGAVFHAYHGYECTVSAYRASRGLRVPTSHGARFRSFDEVLNSSRPSAAAYRQGDFLTVRVRNDALCFDELGDRLPSDLFDEAYLEILMPLVHQFAQTDWRKIR